MKIIDQAYRCNLSGLMSSWSLDCHLQIFRSSSHGETTLVKNVVLVTNMGFEMGWFIPRLLEILVKEVVREFNLDPSPNRLIWIEQYHPVDLQYYQDQNPTGFSMVTLDWTADPVPQREPCWVPLTYEDVQELIGEDLEDSPTHTTQRTNYTPVDPPVTHQLSTHLPLSNQPLIDQRSLWLSGAMS